METIEDNIMSKRENKNKVPRVDNDTPRTVRFFHPVYVITSMIEDWTVICKSDVDDDSVASRSIKLPVGFVKHYMAEGLESVGGRGLSAEDISIEFIKTSMGEPLDLTNYTFNIIAESTTGITMQCTSSGELIVCSPKDIMPC